jgi:hypothetical protein
MKVFPRNIKTEKDILSVINRDSFKELIKQNNSLNKNLSKLNENYYSNMKAIFDSDENKSRVMSFINKLRNKDILSKQKSVSPIQKDLEKIKVNKRFATNKNKYNINHTEPNNNYMNLKKKLLQRSYEENKQNYINEDEYQIQKQLHSIKNKFYQINTAPVYKNKNKKEQFQITFTRVNITTIKNNKYSTNNGNSNMLSKDNFYFSLNSKNDKLNLNLNKKLFQIDRNNNLFFKSNILENYSGYKLSKYEKGELKNNFLLNESIETLNKKFTEELIEINKIPLRFNNKFNYQNEIDLNENFQILPNLNKEKLNKNLISTGMNTIKDKRKYVENGINVNFNSITSNSGNNTDINLKNWNSLFQNKAFSNSKNLFSNSDSRITNNESLNIKDIKEFEFSPIHKLEKSKEKEDINDSYFL